jgi:cytoplasmic iron level regulating protein YaaA (DUF328/UPF0246 family)
MLILLPPSESKAAPRRRGTPVDLATLSAPELAETREAILTELMKVSAEPDAADVLGVSSGRLAEVRRNVDLDRLPRAPTMKVYAGVLYDALDFATLSAAARRRAGRSLRVQSALWGPVGPADLIAPYRLSMATTLPRLGSLARLWRGVLDPVMAKLAGSGVIVDCRSASYAAAWQPSGEAVRRSVSIRVFTWRSTPAGWWRAPCWRRRVHPERWPTSPPCSSSTGAPSWSISVAAGSPST